MTNQDLAFMPATAALAAFRRKALSPVELMRAVIARAEATATSVNALTYTYFDEALEAAKAAEDRYVRGEPRGVLDGLPVGIKDESYIEGLPTSNGSLVLAGQVAGHTSVVNQRILAEGGIVHARTATPEFSCSGVTWSRLWGVTRNPWSGAFTPGGSSGGAAASLASGSSSLATGSDIGGSIRIPASQCGVVGYKPPYGRNPDEPPFNLDFFNHTGPLARSVRDTILLQNVMCGPDASDIAALRPKLVLPDAYAPIAGMRIALSMTLGSFEVDKEVEANTHAAANVLRSLGAIVEEVDIGWGMEVQEACMAYLTHLFGGAISNVLAAHADELTSYALHFGETSLSSSAQSFVGALDTVARMYHTLGPILDRHDALICPTVSSPTVAAEHDQSRDRVIVNGKEVAPTLGWVMTTPFNAMSRCPVLSVPTGRVAAGVPTGMQIVGRTYCDADVFRIGLAYETAVGGWYGAPDRRPAT
ncbi:MAG: amidase [Rhizobiaceae bacterium]